MLKVGSIKSFLRNNPLVKRLSKKRNETEVEGFSKNNSYRRKPSLLKIIVHGFLLAAASHFIYKTYRPPPEVKITKGDTIPDKDGIFLNNVDQILLKAKSGKIKSANLWLTKADAPYYEFIFKDNKRQYLLRPVDAKEVQKLENGLRSLKEPIFITKGYPSIYGDIFLQLFNLLAFFGLMYLIFNRMSGGSGFLGGGWKPAKPETRFSDVRGYPHTIERLRKIVKYIQDASKNKVGAELPRGILLKGPPGTGKTLMARAIAGEAGVPFIAASGSDFIKMFAGLGAARIKALFNTAKSIAKKEGHCIVFIDEIDAIGVARFSSGGDLSKEHSQAINELLNQLDGFEKNPNITLIAATNRPEVLDPGLVRPGRIDLHIEILPPITDQERKDILDLYISKKRLENNQLFNDIDIDRIADNAVGFVGADLENLVKRAALIAFENDQEQITMADFNAAITEIRLGIKRENIIKEEDRWVVGVHEVVGHGIVGLACTRELETVSMIPRGNSLGHVAFRQGQVSELMPSKVDLLENILLMMGGRAGERVVLSPNSFTPGALGDLTQVRQTLRFMLSTGMFEGHYSQDYTNPEIKLRDEDEDLINSIIDKAIDTAEAIIKQKPKEELEALVKKALSLGELKGEDALALYKEFISDSDLENMARKVQSFIEHNEYLEKRKL